ncbi:type VI secretion system Vgr family protein [Ostreiculturibacter nitratireducens]|uniref:type VI secretion system Vgr family protein n=1 Tax=Ostreiculturibacter nitratireducens TaxID=3075226 RepID=UPI0031B60C6B
MADTEITYANRSVWMGGDYGNSKIFLKNARVAEGLSKLTETKIEFLCSDHSLDLGTVVGKRMWLGLKAEDDSDRFFSGVCVSAEYIGPHGDFAHFVAEVRPWLWLLTRTRNSRIFQEKSAPDIIMEILSDHGFSSNVDKKISDQCSVRTYCVQYRETDFDFISRLMEEEGIYYYFVQSEKQEKLVLADSVSAHQPTPGKSTIDFFQAEEDYRRREDHVFEWITAERVTSGKVTLNDFDFEVPKSDQKKVKSIAKGLHSYKNFEIYDHPTRSLDGTAADKFTRVRMEAEAVKHKRAHGVCNVKTFGVGQTFRLQNHSARPSANGDYLVIDAVHDLQIDTEYDTKEPLIDHRIRRDERNKDTYRCEFGVIPKSEPFRAPIVTPWPEISGLHTAIVTGPSGEEIYTDKYGRIKVQFHWDRKGEKDDKSSCWVRCVMPWTGKNWGMISIPRIGQEVAIQFEEGNPDRPICSGMLYNADTMPPYTLPDNMTQTGIVTRSTKTGSTSTFNELIFEDKKDAEFVRLQSEKDYKQIIKNNADITVGMEKKDSGDLTQTIYRNKTETLETGDHSFTVKDGKQTISIKKDHTETIEGKSTQTITGDTTQTVKQGNLTREVSQGNESVTIKMGNFTLKTSMGMVTVEAMQSITLKVGGNSVKIDQSGVTIDGTMVKIKGKAMLEAQSPMTTVKGDALLTLKGGLTMIN